MKDNIGFSAAVFVLLAFIGLALWSIRTTGYDVLTVEMTRDAERVERNGDSSYEVYTNKGTFSNRDDIIHWKWNSGDLQAQFVKGAKCEITVVGLRVHMLSWRKNILKATCSEPRQE
jgi:hypothetical protein